MKTMLTVLLALLSVNTFAQDKGEPTRQSMFTGFFSLIGPFGHVEPMGYVTQGTRIAVDLIALELGSEAPCRTKVTAFYMGANNAGGRQVVVKRATQSPARLAFPPAARGSEVVVVVQGQDPNGACLGSANVEIVP